MYYIGWLIISAMLILWKRDVKGAAECRRYLLKAVRDERREIDAMRDKYVALLGRKAANG
jgi:hypothetical protein